jgi:hypothetical protein
MRSSAVTTAQYFNKRSLSFALLSPGDYGKMCGSTPRSGRAPAGSSNPEDAPGGSVGARPARFFFCPVSGSYERVGAFGLIGDPDETSLRHRSRVLLLGAAARIAHQIHTACCTADCWMDGCRSARLSFRHDPPSQHLRSAGAHERAALGRRPKHARRSAGGSRTLARF